MVALANNTFHLRRMVSINRTRLPRVSPQRKIVHGPRGLPSLFLAEDCLHLRGKHRRLPRLFPAQDSSHPHGQVKINRCSPLAGLVPAPLVPDTRRDILLETAGDSHQAGLVEDHLDGPLRVVRGNHQAGLWAVMDTHLEGLYPRVPAVLDNLLDGPLLLRVGVPLNSGRVLLSLQTTRWRSLSVTRARMRDLRVHRGARAGRIITGGELIRLRVRCCMIRTSSGALITWLGDLGIGGLITSRGRALFLQWST